LALSTLSLHDALPISNVAGVMGDVVGQVQSERGQTGQPSNTGIDHLQVADHMARAVGVTPQETGGSPIQRDLARFGLFVDQALKDRKSTRLNSSHVKI